MTDWKAMKRYPVAAVVMQCSPVSPIIFASYTSGPITWVEVYVSEAEGQSDVDDPGWVATGSDTSQAVMILERCTASVSNGSKSPGRVRFRPGTEPLQRVLPHENPDHCHWAGFTTKNPALQVHNCQSN
jgi:hypothetical protein